MFSILYIYIYIVEPRSTWRGGDNNTMILTNSGNDNDDNNNNNTSNNNSNNNHHHHHHHHDSCRSLRGFFGWFGKFCSGSSLPVSVKKTLLRIRRQAGESALKAPNLELDCSFCCWVAWPGLARKESFCSQKPVCMLC